MPIPYFKPENQNEIWNDVSDFKTKNPEGKLAKVVLKDFNWYYNQWGPEQSDKALAAVIEAFKQNSGAIEWFAYRNYGRWLVGFNQDGAEKKIAEEISQLEIDAGSHAPVTLSLKERTVELNPAKVQAEIQYVEVNSAEELFKK